MQRPVFAFGLALNLLSAAAATVALAAVDPKLHPENNRPPLAFREEFSEGKAQEPANAESLQNKDLVSNQYGPGKGLYDKTWHPNPPNLGAFIWSGSCLQACAYTLSQPGFSYDLRGLAKVVWRTKVSGYHHLHLIIKTPDGKLYASDRSVDGPSTDYNVSEMIFPDLRWRQIDEKSMNDLEPAGGGMFATVDISKVDEIGWSDLTQGSGHGVQAGSSRVDWIELHARKVPR